MKTISAFFLFASLMMGVPAQVLAQKVWMGAASEAVPIVMQHTQTETRPGWTILDIKTKARQTCYLAGAHSTDLADSPQPVLTIFPAENETLANYALIRLKVRANYRRLDKCELIKNDYIRFTPEHFNILPAAALGFACTPHKSLPQGEYIIVYLPQPLGDYEVYPFRVIR